jgi:hypothetical protein
MNKIKNTKEKICAFYASDYHFEMISLPYIDKKMEENDEIIILTENNLEESMKILLEKINLKKDKKEKILKLNWKNSNLEKVKEIQANINKEKNVIIFIKGNENYIRNINQSIEEYIPKANNIKIIDCYNIEEVGENLDEVMKHYDKILKTLGKKEIGKL